MDKRDIVLPVEGNVKTNTLYGDNWQTDLQKEDMISATTQK